MSYMLEQQHPLEDCTNVVDNADNIYYNSPAYAPSGKSGKLVARLLMQYGVGVTRSHGATACDPPRQHMRHTVAERAYDDDACALVDGVDVDTPHPLADATAAVAHGGGMYTPTYTSHDAAYVRADAQLPPYTPTPTRGSRFPPQHNTPSHGGLLPPPPPPSARDKAAYEAEHARLRPMSGRHDPYRACMSDYHTLSPESSFAACYADTVTPVLSYAATVDATAAATTVPPLTSRSCDVTVASSTSPSLDEGVYASCGQTPVATRAVVVPAPSTRPSPPRHTTVHAYQLPATPARGAAAAVVTTTAPRVATTHAHHPSSTPTAAHRSGGGGGGSSTGVVVAEHSRDSVGATAHAHNSSHNNSVAVSPLTPARGRHASFAGTRGGVGGRGSSSGATTTTTYVVRTVVQCGIDRSSGRPVPRPL